MCKNRPPLDVSRKAFQKGAHCPPRWPPLDVRTGECTFWEVIFRGVYLTCGRGVPSTGSIWQTHPQKGTGIRHTAPPPVNRPASRDLHGGEGLHRGGGGGWACPHPEIHCILWDTVKKLAVRILLECLLV